MNSKSLLLVAAVMASSSACRNPSAPDPAAEPSGAAVGVSAGEALPPATPRSAAVAEGANALGVSAGASGEAAPPVAAAPSQPQGAVAQGGCAGEGHACAASQAGVAKPAAASPAGAHEGCLGERLAGPVEKAETTTRVDAVTGASVTVAGFPLGGAPAVPIAELLARPDEFVGKAIRVEGFVATMCFHRRTWFGLRDGTREGRPLQVIAAPAFLVPQGSVGKRARVEGTLEWAEVPASAAAHLAKEHQIDPPVGAAAAAPAIRSVMLRATGAEIF